jgi:phage-related protein
MGKAIGDFAMRAGEYFMEHRTEIYDKAGQFIMEVLKAIVTAVPYIVEGIVYLVGSLVEYIVTHIPDIRNAAWQVMLAFLESVARCVEPAMNAMNNVLQSILDAIGGFFKNMFDAGANIIQSLINGILSGLGPLGDALKGVGDFIVSHKGPPDYDKVMLKPNAELIMGGLTDTIIDSIPALNRAMQMVNGAITVGVTPNAQLASSGNANAQPIAGPTVNVYMNGDTDDDRERGRLIGNEVAYTLYARGIA